MSPAVALSVLMVLIHAGLLVEASRRNFATVDEVGHIASGVSIWHTGSFAAYRVNPPLGRFLATLPVVAARPGADYHRLRDEPGDRPEWDVGRDFIESNLSRYHDLVVLARLAGAFWSVVGAWVVFRWASELNGPLAGCLGVAWWCSDPTVLTFGHLVTPDIPATVAGLAASYTFWRFLKTPGWTSASTAGVLLGIAELTKFTLVINYGIWTGLLGLRFALGLDRGRAAYLTRLAQLALIFFLSLDVINLGYGGKDFGRPLGDFPFVSQTFAGRFDHGWIAPIPVPLPADYLLGIDLQKKDFEIGMPSYLAGEWRNRGWWYYYLYALTVKEPLGSLALAAAGIAATLIGVRRREDWLDTASLLIPPAAFLVFVSSQTGFNHHMRYVLPAFPFVMIAASHLVRVPRRLTRVSLVALTAWSAFGVLSIYPHMESYFNSLGGGPERGHDHLVDSNIDWGQDLLYLKEWVDANPQASPLGLAYFGQFDPRHLGIRYHLPPPGPKASKDGDMREVGPKPGWYALSVNFLRGMKFDAPNGLGEWVPIYRHDYYDYFREFRPVARAGYSIYIFHVTLEQADALRAKLGLPSVDATPPPAAEVPAVESDLSTAS